MSSEPDARTTILASLQAELQLQGLRSVMFHSAVAARLGLTSTDFSCLNVLSMQGPQTPGQLAERIGITRGGAVTAMIDRLEAAGYVRRRRDDTDRRRVLVELEPDRARTSIAPLFAALGAPLTEHLATYGDRDAQLLVGFLSHINDLVAKATAALRHV